ncbi:MAG: hypothetical protein G01um101438_720 [Parcubacteria group bacterium Gr01-1014_38]|nr:MAG: hypothetical protein G01um101438_720 [Parcubacteria group bacterium Gr01-1014_38]
MRGGTQQFRDYRELLFAGALMVFVFSWPLDRRHLVFTEYSFITGAYTEAGTLSLYASDLAFLMLWAAWCWYAIQRPKEAVIPWSVFRAGLALLAWSVFRAFPLDVPIGTGFSTLLGWYGSARIGQGLLIALIAAHVWRSPNLRRVVLWTLVLSGIFQGLLGIGQVLRGGDFGLRFLGEHPLSLQTPGVAKVDIKTYNGSLDNVPKGTSAERTVSRKDVPLGTKVLRAYGTFPHSNVLASFILGSLFASYFLHREKRGTRETFWNLFLIIPFVLSLGLLLTFSRSGWLSFLLLMGTLGVCFYRNIERNIENQRKARFFFLSVTLGILIPLLFSTLRSAAIARIFPEETDTFLHGRTASFYDTFNVLARSPFFGVGTGNGFISLVRNTRNIDNNKEYVILYTREPWKYQYPHNVFLVILLELGAVGGILFLAFLYEGTKFFVLSFRRQSLFARVPVAGVVLAILAVAVLGLTDHYLWTVQQGRILLWSLVGILFGTISRKREEPSPAPREAPSPRAWRAPG